MMTMVQRQEGGRQQVVCCLLPVALQYSDVSKLGPLSGSEDEKVPRARPDLIYSRQTISRVPTKRSNLTRESLLRSKRSMTFQMFMLNELEVGKSGSQV